MSRYKFAACRGETRDVTNRKSDKKRSGADRQKKREGLRYILDARGAVREGERV